MIGRVSVTLVAIILVPEPQKKRPSLSMRWLTMRRLFLSNRQGLGPICRLVASFLVLVLFRRLLGSAENRFDWKSCCMFILGATHLHSQK